MKTNYLKQIKEIMTEFDFEKVHKVMKFLNWKWSEVGVPSINMLKMTAKQLLSEVALSHNDDTWTETGGFRVEKRFNKLTLSFVLESWSVIK